MIEFQVKHFNVPERPQLRRQVEELASRSLKALLTTGAAKTDDDAFHQQNVHIGELLTLTTLNHLIIDPSSDRTWLIRQSPKRPLDAIQAQEYIQSISDWLLKQPPSQHRAMLIQQQVILRNLNGIIFNNDSPTA